MWQVLQAILRGKFSKLPDADQASGDYSGGDCDGVQEGEFCETWADGRWNKGYQAGFVKGVIASGYDGFGSSQSGMIDVSP